MPPIIVFAAAAAAAYAGWKLLRREMDRVEGALEEGRAPVRAARDDLPTLVRDPVTGVYRPDERA